MCLSFKANVGVNFALISIWKGFDYISDLYCITLSKCM